MSKFYRESISDYVLDDLFKLRLNQEIHRVDITWLYANQFIDATELARYLLEHGRILAFIDEEGKFIESNRELESEEIIEAIRKRRVFMIRDGFTNVYAITELPFWVPEHGC